MAPAECAEARRCNAPLMLYFRRVAGAPGLLHATSRRREE